MEKTVYKWIYGIIGIIVLFVAVSALLPTFGDSIDNMSGTIGGTAGALINKTLIFLLLGVGIFLLVLNFFLKGHKK